jgi:hypothetical protein
MKSLGTVLGGPFSSRLVSIVVAVSWLDVLLKVTLDRIRVVGMLKFQATGRAGTLKYFVVNYENRLQRDVRHVGTVYA